MSNPDNNTDEKNELLSVLKNIQIKRSKNISLAVTGCIIAIIFAGLFAYMIYKNNFPIESILSVLLAFFSIFIAVFFYFKADEANSRFYDSSYNFMKDVSVTLGKIEERFGEKLNTMNERLRHIEYEKTETKIELETAESEKDKIIKDLTVETNTSEEKKKLIEDLLIRERKIEQLERRLEEIKLEKGNIYTIGLTAESIYNGSKFLERISAYDKLRLLKNEPLVDLDNETKFLGISGDIIDSEGKATSRGRYTIRHNQS